MRRGFTLVEFLIATSLAGIMAAAITTTVVRQQRFYSAAQEKLELRNRLREIASILSADLKGAAISELGVPFMSDTAVELYTSVATSIACTVAGNIVGLAPQQLSGGNTLTSIIVQPDTGDIALIYGSPYNFPDSGRWSQYRTGAVPPRAASATCPSSSGFTKASDVAAGVTALQLTLSQTASANTRPGSPIHVVRRGRYSLYKSTDGWYLGYRRCNALGYSVCATIQPVSGPYLPYGGTRSGLSFSYYNRAGSRINSSQSATLARVDIVIRSNPAKFTGVLSPVSPALETLKVSVSPRNRLR